MADAAVTPNAQPDPLLQAYTQASAAQTGAELQHSQEKQAAVEPVFGAAQKALGAPVPAQPTPVQLPTPPQEPVVDGKQFEKFSAAMMGLALIGGGLSKSHWMNATSMLNGAMQGYLQGKQALAKERHDKFQEAFKTALEKEEQQNKEYLQALSVRDRSIKEILQQADIIAAKYGMVDAQDAIRRGNLDSIFGAVSSRQTAMDRLKLMKDQLDATVTKNTESNKARLAAAGLQYDENGQIVPLNLSGGAAGGNAALQKQLEIPIQQYLQTGKMPPLGTRNLALRQAIIDGARAEADKMGLTPEDVVTAWSTRQADVSALTQVTRQEAMIGGFEETAKANLDIVMDYAGRLNRTEWSQHVNHWLQYGAQKTGDPDADAFALAVETFTSEYAKVMGGGFGASATTEGAQNRAHAVFGTDRTQAQMKEDSKVMLREMSNRIDKIQGEKQRLVGEIRHGMSTPSTPAAAPSGAQAGGYSLDDLIRERERRAR